MHLKQAEITSGLRVAALANANGCSGRTDYFYDDEFDRDSVCV